jgi:uncharacterized protein (TIGR03083 family)
MSTDAVESLRANLDDLTEVLASLSPEEWESPSACPGWRVQDVVAHMNSSAKMMTGRQAPPAVEGPPPGAEGMAELLIDEQKLWDWRQVYGEYQELGDPFMAALAAMQDEPVASAEVNLGDLGMHPTHILANAFAFDAYCHLRYDICGPTTGVDRDLSDANDIRLRPGIDWMVAGLPQMCAAQLAPVASGAVELELTGPGGGTWVLGAVGDGGLIPITEGAGQADASVRSSAHAFYSWATTRSDWHESCQVSGDETLAAAVLDAINVI